MKPIFIRFLIFILFPSLIFCSSPTSLDTNFNKTGYNTGLIESSQKAIAKAIGTQSDGKVITTGNVVTTKNVVSITRHNVDGSLDSSFGTDGFATTAFGTAAYSNAVAIQSDDKIVIVGYSDQNVLIARYTANGSLDTTFNSTGYILQQFISNTQNTAVDVKIQSNGKIVVIGTVADVNDNDLFIARYNTDGSIDTSFGQNSGYTKPSDPYNVSSFEILSDGSFIISCDYYGSSSDKYLIIVKIDSTGQTVTRASKISYSNSYRHTAADVAIVSNGKIIGLGTVSTSPSQLIVARWNQDLSKDTSFGLGKAYTLLSIPNSTNLTASSVKIDEDNKILATGYVTIENKTQMILARFYIDGSLDTSFGNGTGYITQSVDDLQIAPVNSLLGTDQLFIAGQYMDINSTKGIILSRLKALNQYGPSAAFDTTFDTDGYSTVPTTISGGDNYIGYGVDTQSNGKAVVAGKAFINGTEQIILYRFNQEDGSLDTTFGSNGYTTTLIGSKCGAYAIAIQSDDKIVIAGYSANSNNKYGNLVVRYTKDGQLDTSFNNSGWYVPSYDDNDPEVGAYNLFIDPSNGKITTIGLKHGSNDNDLIVIRYNSNGTFDSSFDGDGIEIINNDGKDLKGIAVGKYKNDKTVVLYSRTSNNYTGTALYALNNNGSTDNEFDNDGKQYFDIHDTDHSVPADLKVQSDGKFVFVGTYFNKETPSASNIFIQRCDNTSVLDKFFGNNGIVTFSLANSSNLTAKTIEIDNNNNIVVTATATLNNKNQIVIIRYRIDGSLDTSFTPSGYLLQELTNNVTPYGSALQADGKILISGQYDNKVFISRFNNVVQDIRTTLLDNAFNTQGYTSTFIGSGAASKSIATTSDGKIVIAGQATVNGKNSLTLARYNIDGTLDTSFGPNNNGYITTLLSGSNKMGARAVAIDYANNDWIIVTGYIVNSSNQYGMLVIRYTADGALDTNFNYPHGYVASNYGSSSSIAARNVLIDKNNCSVTVSGTNNSGDLVITRYLYTGKIDTTFSGSDGTNYIGRDAAKDEALKLYTIYNSSNTGFVILSSNVTSNTKTSTDIDCLQTSNGNHDNNFDDNGKKNLNISNTDQTIAADLVVQPDNKFVFTGTYFIDGNTQPSGIFIQRCDNRGDFDTSFGSNGLVKFELDNSTNLTAQKIYLYDDNKIGILGTVTFNNQDNIITLRFNTNGSLDTTFSSSGYALTPMSNSGLSISDCLLLPNQKIAFTGQYSNALLVGGLETMSKQWEADSSFNSDHGYNTMLVGGPFEQAKAKACATQSNGKIITAGTSVTNQPVVTLARYKTDGTINTNFGGLDTGYITTAIGSTVDVTSMTIYPVIGDEHDDKVLVAGTTTIDSQQAAFIVRYNADGTLDTTFGSNGIVTSYFLYPPTNIANAIKIQSDRKIVTVGKTGDYGYIARYTTTGATDTTFGTSSGSIRFTTSSNLSCNAINFEIKSDGSFIVFCNNIPTQLNPSTSVGVIFIPNDGSGYDVPDNSILDIDANNEENGIDFIPQYEQFIGVGTVEAEPSQIFVARWNNDGSLDTTFGDSNGYTLLSIPNTTNLTATSTMLQYDGAIIVVGKAVVNGVSSIVLARYLNDGYYDGMVDSSFGTDGYVILPISDYNIDPFDCLVTSDKKWVIAGQYTNTSAPNYSTQGIIATQCIGNSEELVSTTSVSTSSTESTINSYGTNESYINDFINIEFIVNKIFNQSSISRTRDTITCTRTKTLYDLIVSTIVKAGLSIGDKLIDIFKDFYSSPTLRTPATEKKNSQSDRKINYIKYLYILRVPLNNAQKDLMKEFPDYKKEITAVFNAVRRRIDILSRTFTKELLPL